MSNDKVINKNAYKPFFEFSQNILNFHKKLRPTKSFLYSEKSKKAIYVSYKQIPSSYDMFFKEETFQTQKQKVEGKYM